MRQFLGIFKLPAIAVASLAVILALVIGGVWAYTSVDEWIAGRKAASLSHLDVNRDGYLKVAANPGATVEGVCYLSANDKPVLVTVSNNENRAFGVPRCGGHVDPLTLDLPQELFPASVADVKTVVALRWGQMRAREYANGAVGMRETCRVDGFDLASGQRIAGTSFSGSDPPHQISGETTRRGSLVFGGSCNKVVMVYVLSLYAGRKN